MLLASGPVQSGEILCEIDAKYACAAIGCEPNRLDMWNVTDLDGGQFSRCDRNGCDTYPAMITQSGLFYVIEATGHGAMAKLAIDGSSYLEVATVGTVALISFGSCRSASP